MRKRGEGLGREGGEDKGKVGKVRGRNEKGVRERAGKKEGSRGKPGERG